MLALVLSKITNWWKIGIGALVALIPVVAYVLGRKDAGHKAELDKALRDAQIEKDNNDFLIRMDEANNEALSNRPDNIDDLIERLRKSGL